MTTTTPATRPPKAPTTATAPPATRPANATPPASKVWTAMPGWGIAADLTPPELINSRQVRRLQKYLLAALLALVVVVAGGYVVAARHHSAAAGALATEQARTSPLRADALKYEGITTLQGTVTEVQTHIAQLMAGDVDLVTLMAKVSGRLPPGMTIGQESLTITQAGTAKSGPGLDSSHIGTVTLTGAGRTLDDVATYVDRLKAIPGLVEVVPTSTVSDKAGVQFTIAVVLTTALLSHRFDVSKTGVR